MGDTEVYNIEFNRSSLMVQVSSFNSEQTITRSTFNESILTFRSFYRDYPGYGNLWMFISDSGFWNRKVQVVSENFILDTRNTTMNSDLIISTLFDQSNISMNFWKCKVEGSMDISTNSDRNLELNITDSIITDIKSKCFLAIQKYVPMHTNIRVKRCTFRNSSEILKIQALAHAVTGRTLDIDISESKFFNNHNLKGGALISVEIPMRTKFQLTLKNSLFYKNGMKVLEIYTNHVVSVASQISSSFLISAAITISLENVIFQDNSAYSLGELSAIVELLHIDSTLITDCHFINNTGTAVQASFSVITLKVVIHHS